MSDRRLGDISTISYGYTAKASHSKQGPKFLRITDIQNGKVDWDSVPTCVIDQDDLEKHRLYDGDIVFARTGATTGKSYRIANAPEAVAASYLIRVRITDDNVDPRFVELFFQTKSYWDMVALGTSGSAQGGFNASKLAEMKVHLPSLPEQKRIVAILDEAFAGIETAIANTERNLANARELFESYLNHVLIETGEEWPKRKLEGTCDNLDSKRVPITKANRKPGDIPYYGASGIVDYVEDYIFDEDLLLVSEDGANLLARSYPIAFSISGKTWVNNHAHVLRFNNYQSQRFIEYYLNSISLERYVSGMAQPKLNQKALNSILVPFPPVEIQAEAVDKLDDMRRSKDRLIAVSRQKVAALTELKQSLLQKVFSGELTASYSVSITSLNKVQGSPRTESPEFAAHIMAAAYHSHESQGCEKTYGHVKAQKTLHLVESLAQINLGRIPVKAAAGPNDFDHMLAAEEWAKENEFFEFVQRPDGQRGYDFVKGKRYDEWITKALQAIGPHWQTLDRVVGLLLPLNTEKAELVATVYAAWNNLLLDRIEPKDAEIIHEARENWHKSKRQYKKLQFQEAIEKLRHNGLTPTGTGKRVGGQENLAL